MVVMDHHNKDALLSAVCALLAVGFFVFAFLVYTRQPSFIINDQLLHTMATTGLLIAALISTAIFCMMACAAAPSSDIFYDLNIHKETRDYQYDGL